MNELVKLVMKKTGLPEETANTAVETVINFIKQELPDPIAGQVDNLLDGKDVMEQAKNLTAGLGNMFGKGK